MIALYGFLHGDTMGLLILARPEDTVAELAIKLQKAAAVRVAASAHPCVLHRGRVLEPSWTLAQAGIQALDRFDVQELPPQ